MELLNWVFFKFLLSIWSITFGLIVNDPQFSSLKRAILPFSLQIVFGTLELHGTCRVRRRKEKNIYDKKFKIFVNWV